MYRTDEEVSVLKDPIPVTRSWLPAFDEYVDEIRDLWDSRWLTNVGEKHKQLEARLAEYLDVPYVALFTNGHLALETALQALEIQGEVITTPFTFASSTHAIVRSGLTPVFGDIRPDDYTLDAQKLESMVTEKTAAILPVHVYGHLCDYEAIEAVARRHGLKVVYDAAHTFGMTVNGRGVATLGDVSMFSFHATKVFHTIEGGALTTTDGDLYEKIVQWRNFGIASEEEILYPGGNGKMSEFQAAMGLCCLPQVEAEIARRSRVVARYRMHLAQVPGIHMSTVPAGVKSNYAYFPIVLDGYPLSRNRLFEALQAEGITARKYFYPLTSQTACCRNRFNPGFTPLATAVAERVLCLPLYGEMTDADVDRVCRVIGEF